MYVNYYLFIILHYIIYIVYIYIIHNLNTASASLCVDLSHPNNLHLLQGFILEILLHIMLLQQGTIGSFWLICSYNYDFHILPISEQMLLPLDILCFFSADHNSRTGPSKPRSSTSLLCGPSGSPEAHGLSSVYGHTNTMVTVLTDLGHRTRYLGYNGNLD